MTLSCIINIEQTSSNQSECHIVEVAVPLGVTVLVLSAIIIVGIIVIIISLWIRRRSCQGSVAETHGWSLAIVEEIN